MVSVVSQSEMGCVGITPKYSSIVSFAKMSSGVSLRLCTSMRGGVFKVVDILVSLLRFASVDISIEVNSSVESISAAGRSKTKRFRNRSEYQLGDDSPIICSNCGRQSHNKRTCPNPKTTPTECVPGTDLVQFVLCSHCGEEGHLKIGDESREE